MKLIYDSNTIKTYASLLKSFETIYNNGFPDINERESFDAILNRLSENREANEPPSILVLHTDGEMVNGGLIADWYQNSAALHLTYLIVNPKRRKSGIGKNLIQEGIKMVIDWIAEQKKVQIDNVFFESNNPLKTIVKDDFDAYLRLKFFSKLGAKFIDIPYIQPPLDSSKKKVDNLFLFSFTQFNKYKDQIKTEKVQGFLKEFYAGLGENERNEDLMLMCKNLDMISDDNECITLKSLIESGKYQFNQASITYHFIENVNKEDKNPTFVDESVCEYFHSFETDLLNYKNQKAEPFATKYIKHVSHAELIFPEHYDYTSEGNPRVQFSEREKLKVNFSISVSLIKDTNTKIIHLTIAPAENEYFSEYDLIKLTSLFGSTQESRDNARQKRMECKIQLPTKNETKIYSLSELLQKYLNHAASYDLLHTGIAQIDLSQWGKNLALRELLQIFLSDNRINISVEKQRFLKILCGIILGIFDFERMNNEEIYDTIIPIVKHPDSFVVINRGTLLKISAEAFMEEIPSCLIVSPYLLVPSMLLSYNEYILNNVSNSLDQSMNSKRLADMEQKQKEIRQMLNIHYLTDIFQYPSEKEIIAYGNKQRGITTTYDQLSKRLTDLKEIIDAKRFNRSNISDAALNAILGSIAMMQIKDFLMQKFEFKYEGIFFYLFVILVACVIFAVVRAKKSH